jgi:hypothetical protein
MVIADGVKAMSSPAAVDQLFDVSVLFDSIDRARAAWTTVFKTQEPNRTLAFPNLNGFATLVESAMPAGDLDRRLVGDGFPLGAAYVGMTLGMLAQLEVRRMRAHDYPDPWAKDGRLRLASLLVTDLLALGGHAVVLHKAAALVKTREHLLHQLGDLRDEKVRPYLAWLDIAVFAAQNGGLEGRSYGMPHYFGAPNFRVAAQGNDPFSLEATSRAIKYACGVVAAGNENPLTLQRHLVPLWFFEGRGVPRTAEPAECITFTAVPDADGIIVDLQADELAAAHPFARWNAEAARPGSLPFELYARALADVLMRSPNAQGLRLVACPLFVVEGQPPNGRLPVRVLVFENARMAFYVTAGFGRVPAPRGTEAAATAHAEFCLFGPPGAANEKALCSALLQVGNTALTTQVPGGLKDWEGLPPAPNGWSSLMVPQEDVPLTKERPIALRLVLPTTSEERAAFVSGADRPAWYRSTITGADAIAARWSNVVGPSS